MTDLIIRKLNKSYGRNHVLKDVDLAIADGEFVVIVGPSGCGKSTLLRVISGLEKADSGSIEMSGVVVNDLPPASRKVAMVFQSYALYPHLTVAENLSFGLLQAGTPQAEVDARVDEVCRMLAVQDFRDRIPSALSGGQRQRVALGRALIRKPTLFLFDEPLSNLDAALRMNTRIEIARIHRTLGTTILYVTHDQTEAMTLADKIIVMRDGKIEQIGPPMELYNTPANRFVAGFLGSPAMNFLSGGRFGGEKTSTIGIRPQQLRLAKQGRIQGSVVHYERLGSDTHVIVDAGGSDHIVASLSGQCEFKIGQPLSLDYEDEDALMFGEQGERV